MILCVLVFLSVKLPVMAQTRSVQDQAVLRDILGSDPSLWKFSQQQFSVGQLDGRNVLSSGSNALVLSGTEKFPAGVEYRLVFRMTSRPASATTPTLAFRIGLKGPGDTSQTAPGCYLSGNLQTSTVTWYVYGNKGWKIYGNYTLKSFTGANLSWPDALRKSVELEITRAPTLTHKWLTLRYVVRKNSVETYIDDRLLDIRTGDNLETSGSIKLTLSSDVAVASLRVKPLPPDDAGYRPVSISGFLNASLINGKQIDRSTMPEADTPVRIGKVPFLFPQPDSSGNDHISLFNSWARFSAMETYVESQGGQFSGRWHTALTVDPTRIQLRVPYDHYTKLYLIAAAGNQPNSVPLVTAQFYKALSGYPENFESRVPLFTAQSTDAIKLPVKQEDGGSGALYLVSIPLDPGKLSKFGNLSILELELTKGVYQYRSYPDPICYSYHQGGLPSDVHIYALTLERSPLRMTFEPDKFGHVWTSPATPSYTVTLGNRTSVSHVVELILETESHDHSEKTQQKQNITVAHGDKDTLVRFTIAGLKRYGYHEVTLTMKDGAQTWVEKRSLAYLQVDTRERGNWDDGRGPILGFWAWGGGHETPTRLQELEVMAEAGAEALLSNIDANTPADVVAFARQHHFLGFFRFGPGNMWTMSFDTSPLREKWNPEKPDEITALLLEELRKVEVKPDALNRSDLAPFFAEPGLWPSTYGNLPEYWGEPEYKLTPNEERIFKKYLDKFLAGARLVRKNWPDVKILLPYGDPLFVIPFLRKSAEARDLIDGSALDMPGFERMPEQQLHQVCHHRLYELINEYRRWGKKPVLAVVEGTFAPTLPGALTYDEQADIYTRNFLIYFAYGVYRQLSGPTPFDCADYWGEEHYGCPGLFTRMPYACPKPSYVAYATLSRHLNRANYEKWLTTGSLSTYALQFKHYKTGKLIHVFWTIRGKRPVTLTVQKDAQVTVYDQDDNPTVLTETDGKVTFTIDSSPRYVEGLTTDPEISLGTPDHSDSKPAGLSVKLGNPGDGSWKIFPVRDLVYENNHPLQIARFKGNMKVTPVKAPEEQGATALAVHLEKQEQERKVMPWYTSIVPEKPIVIPGKASHIGLWVNAASDWGRVIYCLRDAKGQKWISIGTKEQWNCDDTHQWSSFCFDGWRYLRFEMPSNLPYDNFREAGSTWWGHHGPGGGIVHLPLALEKIIIERRTHAMYVNDPQPARPDDVLLGDLIAEYATEFDKTEDVVAQSRITMKVPEGIPNLWNPIETLTAQGTGTVNGITHIDPPEHEYDGTRCLVFFNTTPDAVSYDIWVGPYADGTGAIRLGVGWKKPGGMITGLRPETEFYAFVVCTYKDGKMSKPSKPFRFALKDMFPIK